MNQNFILISVNDFNFFAIPAACAGMPLLQALSQAREVSRDYISGQGYVFKQEENAGNPLSLQFRPVFLVEPEPTPTDDKPDLPV